jgi:hypothetical protein
MKHILVALLSQNFPIAQVVCQKVVGVLLGYCAIKVGEKYTFRVCFHGWEGRGKHHGVLEQVGKKIEFSFEESLQKLLASKIFNGFFVRK